MVRRRREKGEVVPPLSPMLAPPTLGVGGRLRYFASQWDLLGSKWHSSVVRCGYRIPLVSAPNGGYAREFYGDARVMEVVKQHVGELVAKDAVEAVNSWEARRGFTSPLIMVRKKTGQMRPCLDLRALNASVPYEKFKMEGIRQMRQLVREGDFLTSIDLTDGYLHVPVAKQSRRWLQFRFLGRYYRFKCLPFGLSSAPRIFTKMLRPVIQRCREEGIRILAYLDDIFIASSSYEESVRHTGFVLDLLQSLGWLINVEKSSLVPATRMEFLGFLVDTARMELLVTTAKRKKYRACARRMAQKIRDGLRLQLRSVAGMLGKLQSLTQAVRYGKLHLQALTELVRSHTEGRAPVEVDWGVMVRADEAQACELEWWQALLATWRGNSLLEEPVEIEMFSDASGSGYGGYLVDGSRSRDLVQGWWSPEEQRQSINTKELWAAERTVAAFLKWRFIQGSAIRLFTDNQVAAAYLRRMGGRKEHLRVIAERIWARCEVRGVFLTVEYVEGKKNVIADALSRVEGDSSEWKLDPAVFGLLQWRWGPHTVDFFASRDNAQLPRFATWRADEWATYIDGLSHLRAKENGYANPPFAIIGKVLQRLYLSSRSLTLVVPAWPSQLWWPMAMHMLVDVPMLLPHYPGVMAPTFRRQEEVPVLPWRYFALRISGNSSTRKAFRAKLRRHCCPGGQFLRTIITSWCGNGGRNTAGADRAVDSILHNLIS